MVLRLVEAVSAIDSRDTQRDAIHDVLVSAAGVADKRGVGVAGPAGKGAIPWILGISMNDDDRAARQVADNAPVLQYQNGKNSTINSLGCRLVKALLSLKPVLLRPVIDRLVSTPSCRLPVAVDGRGGGRSLF